MICEMCFLDSIYGMYFLDSICEKCVSSAGSRVNSVQYFFVEFLDELVRLCPFIDFVFVCYVVMFGCFFMSL